MKGNEERTVPVVDPRFPTAQALARITSVPREIRSRRKRWLQQNPDYYDSASRDLELSDPLLYDRLIRQHQTAAERELEGRKRGWAGTLETSLLRSEAKLMEADPTNPKYHPKNERSKNGTSVASKQAQRQGPKIDWTVSNTDLEEDIHDGKNLTEEGDNELAKQNVSAPKAGPTKKHLGQQKWHDLLAQRFIDGHDDDFDYITVDRNESLDEDWVGQRSQETWFDEEEEDLENCERETGIQDF